MTEKRDTLWPELVERATSLRRELHRQPELGWSEHATAARIRSELDRLGIAWRVCAETGTVATLAPQASGEHIALRADIDALPIHEQSGVEWQSRSEGCMHACGHDGHTATLMAAAEWLKHQEPRLPGPVTLLFQPAEEGGHGAKRMVEEGALAGVDRVFGWHNWPAIPRGRAVCPDGPVMAGNGTFRMTVRGAGGHASQPELCRDPVLAASAITLNMQQLVSRRIAPQDAVVVSITSIEAPSGETVIPDRAVLAGSIRLADTGLRGRVQSLISEIARDTAQTYGVDVETEHFPRYEATVNHAGAAEAFRRALEAELGEHWRNTGTAVPIMASEDFSYYLEACPGAFALIGSGEADGENFPCHSARYDFHDGLIPEVARVYLRLAGAPLPM